MKKSHNVHFFADFIQETNFLNHETKRGNPSKITNTSSASTDNVQKSFLQGKSVKTEVDEIFLTGCKVELTRTHTTRHIRYSSSHSQTK